MSNETQVLLSNITAESVDSTFAYSDKKPGAGYHKYADPLHTAVYVVDSFIGSIKLQGTLAIDPAETDWFDIENTSLGLGDDSTLWATPQSVNFVGNFVWIRAAYNLQNGTITQIQYNF
jgi:hypothetical protein